MDKVPARLYSHVEVQNARTKGQVWGSSGWNFTQGVPLERA